MSLDKLLARDAEMATRVDETLKSLVKKKAEVERTTKELLEIQEAANEAAAERGNFLARAVLATVEFEDSYIGEGTARILRVFLYELFRSQPVTMESLHKAMDEMTHRFKGSGRGRQNIIMEIDQARRAERLKALEGDSE